MFNNKHSNSRFDFVTRRSILSKPKRSQAQIITVVLIILLVLVTVVIIWRVVRGTVKESIEKVEVGTECLTLNFEIVKAKTGESSIEIRRETGEGELDKIKVLVSGSVVVDGADATGLDELEIMPIDLGGHILAKDELVEIAAVLKNGKLCNVVDAKIV